MDIFFSLVCINDYTFWKNFHGEGVFHCWSSLELQVNVSHLACV